MIYLPPGKMRSDDVPLLAFAIGGEDERAFARADEDSDGAHEVFPF